MSRSQGVLRPGSVRMKYHFLSFMGAKLISQFRKMYSRGLQDGAELWSSTVTHGWWCQIPSKEQTSAMQSNLSGSQFPSPRKGDSQPMPYQRWSQMTKPSPFILGNCVKLDFWLVTYDIYIFFNMFFVTRREDFFAVGKASAIGKNNPGVSVSSITRDISTSQCKYWLIHRYKKQIRSHRQEIRWGIVQNCFPTPWWRPPIRFVWLPKENQIDSHWAQSGSLPEREWT